MGRRILSRVSLLVSSALAAVAMSACLVVIDADALDEGCASDQKACEGRCVSKSDPEYGCGSDSCQPCFLPNAQSICDSRQQCAIATCVDNHDDCDGKANTGCEVNLDTDVNHCGSCRAEPCEVKGAIPACARGRCAIRKCEPGFKDCNRESDDGCEVPVLRNDENCGACGLSCEEDQSCDEGVCQ